MAAGRSEGAPPQVGRRLYPNSRSRDRDFENQHQTRFVGNRRREPNPSLAYVLCHRHLAVPGGSFRWDDTDGFPPRLTGSVSSLLTLVWRHNCWVRSQWVMGHTKNGSKCPPSQMWILIRDRVVMHGPRRFPSNRDRRTTYERWSSTAPSPALSFAKGTERWSD